MELFVAKQVPGREAARCVYERFLEILVEYGIDFTCADLNKLAEPFSADLKALIVPEAHVQPYRKKARYVKSWDDVLAAASLPEEEELQKQVLVLLTNAGLTQDAPAFRTRMIALDDETLLQQLSKALKNKLTKDDFGFGDPDVWFYGRPALEWYRASGDQDMLKLIRRAAEGRQMKAHEKADHTDDVAALRNLAFLYQETGEKRYLEPVLQATQAVYDQWPRIDGLPVHRIGRDAWIWNEVSAMYGGTAAYLGTLTDSTHLYEDALLLAFKLRDWCQDADGLYFHAGRPGEHTPVKWARGMGWALYGIMELLDTTKEHTEAYASLCAILDKAFTGLACVQRPNGLWGNVLTNPLSLPESSGTCMFVTVYARALAKGWCKDHHILPVLEHAWQGLKCCYFQNKLVNFCRGTAMVCSELHYLRRPHHGYLPYGLLWAGLELKRARQKG